MLNPAKKCGPLGVILARGGSKSIYKKSIAPCAGNPLLAYTIDAVKHATLLDRVILCTDDEEIADLGRSLGVEVPFMEPKELAGEDCPDLPVMQYVLSRLIKRGEAVPEMVVHLRPTTPLKASVDIDKAIELLRMYPEADSVRSACEPLHTPFKMYRLDEGELYLKPILMKEYPEVFEKYSEPHSMPRQVLPVVWRHSGYVDCIRPDVITEKNSMCGSRILPLMFEKWRDVDIDSADDLLRAEIIIGRLKTAGKEPWQS